MKQLLLLLVISVALMACPPKKTIEPIDTAKYAGQRQILFYYAPNPTDPNYILNLVSYDAAAGNGPQVSVDFGFPVTLNWSITKGKNAYRITSLQYPNYTIDQNQFGVADTKLALLSEVDAAIQEFNFVSTPNGGDSLYYIKSLDNRYLTFGNGGLFLATSTTSDPTNENDIWRVR